MEEGHDFRLHEREVTHVVRRKRLPEPFFCARYSLSPYQGCGHGCLYCDGRAEKYHVEGDYERDIVTRENVAPLLERELRLLREKSFVAIGSGISDAYQPAEAVTKLTRRCAEVLAGSSFPVILATKSSLVLRDLDVWQTVARRNGFVLMMSIVTTEDDLRVQVEPGASSIAERFKTLETFKQAGCWTGILAMPLLPGLSDSSSAFRRLLDRAQEAGVDFLIPGGLTLRPGRQKDLFMRYVASTHPNLIELYAKLYAEERRSGAPVRDYEAHLYDTVHGEIGGRLPSEIPHHVFKTSMGVADEILILMHHMESIYGRRGKDTRRLRRAIGRYSMWLDMQRRQFNRRRSLPPSWVEDQLVALLSDRNALHQLLENERLEYFLREATAPETCFDYVRLKLVRSAPPQDLQEEPLRLPFTD